MGARNGQSVNGDVGRPRSRGCSIYLHRNEIATIGEQKNESHRASKFEKLPVWLVRAGVGARVIDNSRTTSDLNIGDALSDV